MIANPGEKKKQIIAVQEILFELSWTVSAKTCNEAAVLILQGCSVEFGDVVMLKGSKLYNLEQEIKKN